MRRPCLPATAIVALSCVCACKVQQSWTEPDPHLERMMDQERVDPFQGSRFFDDGIAMRDPPPGTVSLEHTLGGGGLEDGRIDGRDVDDVPVPLTRVLLDRGRDRFDVYCGACHGLDGSGETVVAQNMALRKPPSLHERRIRAMPVGKIFRVITTGYGLMPPYAAYLDVGDRWAVVAYVRALQLSRRADVASLPSDARAELERVAP